MRAFQLAVVALGLSACATIPDEPIPYPDDATLPPVELATASAPAPTVAFSASAAAEAPSAIECKDKFLSEKPPVLENRPPASDVRTLCFTYFAVLHSGSKRGPLWSAYLLTKKMSQDGDAFDAPRPPYAEEERLPEDHRSREKDYDDNVYDVGHMTPNNDMPDKASQIESFSMANMSPQVDSLNGGNWRVLEAAVHKLAQTSGPLYIVTGPIFAASPVKMSKRVAIPKSFFKAVYDQSTGRAIVFVYENKKGAKCQLLSVAKLETLAKINPFPTLSDNARKESGTWSVPKACKQQ